MRGPDASALPSTYIPPWAGGPSRREVPRGVLRTRQPPVHPPPRCEHLTPRNTRGRGTQRQEGRLRHWHVHQLFHRLRLAGHGAPQVDRGHSDNLLDRGRLVEAGEDLNHHFHHLRHSNIEDRHRRHRHLDLRHAAPLNPLLRSGHGRQLVRPGACGRWLIVVKEEVLHTCRLGRRMRPERGHSASRDPPPRPWPSSDLLSGA